MSKRFPVYAAVLTSLLFCLFSVMAQAQERPVCQYTSSDADGDGFGWENLQTCIVADNTSSDPAPMCLDDDGDGYGWDGSKVCRVDVMCYDTYPLGDGFGWDGSKSCEIAAYDAPFSEIQILKNESRPNIRFGVVLPAATVVCTTNNSVEEFDLFANGRIERSFNGSRNSTGLWSTGFEVSDGLLHLTGVGVRWLVLSPNSVGKRNSLGLTSDCSWQ